jgi:signal transduction histidine kinase
VVLGLHPKARESKTFSSLGEAFQGPTQPMSLRTKIILLFVGLSVVPLLILAAFSYWQVETLLRSTIQGQLQETAMRVGQELEAAELEITAALDAVGGSFSSTGLPPGGVDASNLTASQDSLLAMAVFIQRKDPSGFGQTVFGSVPEDPIQRCIEEGSMLLEFSSNRPPDRREITAGFWAADLISREGGSLDHSLAVLDQAEGSVLYSDRCETVQAGDRLAVAEAFGGVLSASGVSGTLKYREDRKTRLGAFVRVSGSKWMVVSSSDPAAIVGPLNSLVMAYWVLVLGLGLSTALAFYLLLGRFTKSLRDLARAAEEIGNGEMDPWLPLPSSGEVGQLTVAFNRMLARIRHMMSQVDQSGRLAVVGQLSAYLAHEIRNPLSSIKLNLQRLRRWTINGTLPDFCLEPLEISLKEVERLSASVSDVLQMSRAEDSPREVLSLHELVEEAAELLSARFKVLGIGLHLDLDAEADRVMARPGQVKSVILNLMVNAIEAQPKGGRLEIRSELSRAPGIGGPVVALHFKDGGEGVPAGIRDRIFEPFFTTKGGGSGIGLAIASQSVRANEGDLYLETALSTDSGAEFVMAFPLAALETARELPAGPVFPGGQDRSLRWAVRPQIAREGSPPEPGVPSHLMTPEGLKAVLALSISDPEEVN